MFIILIWIKFEGVTFKMLFIHIGNNVQYFTQKHFLQEIICNLLLY